jgi:vanillate O-demethylase ferredoxin subunit
MVHQYNGPQSATQAYLEGISTMAHKHLKVVVSGIRQLTPRIREYQFTSLDGAPMPEYTPGSHLAIHTGSEYTGPLVRHYSLIGGTDTRDDARNTYRVAVQREDRGGGSAFIHANFELGSRLEVAVPANNFPLDRRDSHRLLLAGGIGITPIYSMVRSLARRKQDFSVVYAGRDVDHMAYHDELLRLAGDRARIHVSGPADSGKLDMDALLCAQPAGTTAYVCGPAAMVEATHAAARAAGWTEDQVRSELFGTGFSGDEVAFDVVLRRSNRVIRVAKDVTILDALVAARADVLWDCRRGECGLCQQTVLATDGALVHRDRYLSDAERAGCDAMCVCVSRTRGTRLELDL